MSNEHLNKMLKELANDEVRGVVNFLDSTLREMFDSEQLTRLEEALDDARERLAAEFDDPELLERFVEYQRNAYDNAFSAKYDGRCCMTGKLFSKGEPICRVGDGYASLDAMDREAFNTKDPYEKAAHCGPFDEERALEWMQDGYRCLVLTSKHSSKPKRYIIEDGDIKAGKRYGGYKEISAAQFSSRTRNARFMRREERNK